MAIKKIKEGSFFGSDFLEEFRKEAQLMKSIAPHSNVVQLVSVLVTKD